MLAVQAQVRERKKLRKEVVDPVFSGIDLHPAMKPGRFEEIADGFTNKEVSNLKLNADAAKQMALQTSEEIRGEHKIEFEGKTKKSAKITNPFG